MQFKWREFSALKLEELYAILALRSAVFVVDQQCIYLDMDNKDNRALHLLGIENNELVAYLRLFPHKKSQNKLRFGRVITAKSHRGRGHGKRLIKEMLNYCKVNFPDISIECSAQSHLKDFYRSFGFETQGEVYDECGIPHIDMQKI